MPFALLTIGIVMLVSGVRNTTGDLYTLVKSDFSGSKNFLYWFFSILVIGSIGYIPTFKNFSRAFLILVIIVLILSNKGFFDKFSQQFFQSNSGV